MSEKCPACMDVKTIIGRHAAGCPMTADELRDVIRRIIRGHHTEIDRLLAENEQLQKESVRCFVERDETGECITVHLSEIAEHFGWKSPTSAGTGGPARESDSGNALAGDGTPNERS